MAGSRIEGLDDEHAAATAGTRLGEWLGCRWIDLDGLFGRRRCQSQKFTRSRDRLGAIAAGEQAVVANAMEALGQNVDQKPAAGGSSFFGTSGVSLSRGLMTWRMVLVATWV